MHEGFYNEIYLFQDGPSPGKKYRGYSQENLAKAFKAVTEKKMPVQRAAREYGVPESTLRDRIKGKVPLQKTRSGPPPVLGMKEENKLVEYLMLLSDFGYSFSRSDVVNMATDFAVVLGKRDPNDTFTHQWYYSFLSRWPGAIAKRPFGNKLQCEKASSLDSLTNYYYQLQSTLKRYNLNTSPDSLFVIDEICINMDRSPPEVLSWRDVRYDRNRQEMRPTLTLLVCGNSTGARLPGFFIFPGKTVSSESIEDCSPGTGATCSDDGATNSSVFQLYLENHFLKFIERKEETQSILLLYDGHRTHISPALIELYKKQYVHLFPLPPFVSQSLVELSSGIFQDFPARFNEESDHFLETELERSIHSSVCVVACKAYKRAVNSAILKSYFKNIGIYPFNPEEVDSRIDLSKPNLPVKKKAAKEKLAVKWHSPRHTKQQYRHAVKVDDQAEQARADFEEIESEMFGGKKRRKKKSPKVTYKYNYSNRRKSATPRPKKQKLDEQPGGSEKTPKLKLKLRKKSEMEKRNTKSKRSKRMNESTTEESSIDTESTDSEIEEMLSSDEHDIDDYDAQTKRLAFETSLREELETSRLYFEYNQKQFKLMDSPVKEPSYEVSVAKEQPATSEEYVYETVVTSVVTEEKIDEMGNVIQEQPNLVEEKQEKSDEVEEQQIEEPEIIVKVENIQESVEEEIPTSETCCVCNKYHPDKAHEGYVIEFATWGKCDYPNCEHWTHLKYCCDIKVLRRHDVFHCPCHKDLSS